MSIEPVAKPQAERAEISVVIATFNREELLHRCLQALEQQPLSPVFEVIVVDDGSSDNTAKVVAEFQQKTSLSLTYLHQPNQGPAAARNLGIQHVSGDLTAFLDDDHIPSPTWIAEISRLPSAPQVAGLCGRAFSLPGTNWVSRYCAFSGFHERPRLNPDGTVEHMVTGNSLVRTAILREIGGFDTRFNSVFKGIAPGGEDTALSLSLSQRNYRVHYNPNAITHQRQKEALTSIFKENFNFGTNRVLWNHLLGNSFSFGRTLWRVFRTCLTTPFVFLHSRRFYRNGAGRLDGILFAILERLCLIAYQTGTLLGIVLLDRRATQPPEPPPV